MFYFAYPGTRFRVNTWDRCHWLMSGCNEWKPNLSGEQVWWVWMQGSDWVNWGKDSRVGRLQGLQAEEGAAGFQARKKPNSEVRTLLKFD